MQGIKAFFAGNLGKDAELKETKSDKPEKYLSFSIAVKPTKKDASSYWINCTIWGKRAPTVADYLKKGMRLSVVGTLEPREYQDRDGVTRTVLECRVDDFDFVSASTQESKSGNGNHANATAVASQQPAAPIHLADDDIPF